MRSAKQNTTVAPKQSNPNANAYTVTSVVTTSIFGINESANFPTISVAAQAAMTAACFDALIVMFLALPK